MQDVIVPPSINTWGIDIDVIRESAHVINESTAQMDRLQLTPRPLVVIEWPCDCGWNEGMIYDSMGVMESASLVIKTHVVSLHSFIVDLISHFDWQPGCPSHSQTTHTILKDS